jgi:hypothetical protein
VSTKFAKLFYRMIKLCQSSVRKRILAEIHTQADPKMQLLLQQHEQSRRVRDGCRSLIALLFY